MREKKNGLEIIGNWEAKRRGVRVWVVWSFWWFAFMVNNLFVYDKIRLCFIILLFVSVFWIVHKLHKLEIFTLKLLRTNDAWLIILSSIWVFLLFPKLLVVLDGWKSVHSYPSCMEWVSSHSEKGYKRNRAVNSVENRTIFLIFRNNKIYHFASYKKTRGSIMNSSGWYGIVSR